MDLVDPLPRGRDWLRGRFARARGRNTTSPVGWEWVHHRGFFPFYASNGTVLTATFDRIGRVGSGFYCVVQLPDGTLADKIVRRAAADAIEWCEQTYLRAADVETYRRDQRADLRAAAGR